MGFVSAQDDLNETLQTDEIASFSDLENDIYNANGTLELQGTTGMTITHGEYKLLRGLLL